MVKNIQPHSKKFEQKQFFFEQADELGMSQHFIILLNNIFQIILQCLRYFDKSCYTKIVTLVSKSTRSKLTPMHHYNPCLDFKLLLITGGFQLEFVSLSRVINHMTCDNFKCSHWWKIYLRKIFYKICFPV